MLQKMGWSEGKGLGANEDGMTDHVKITKKDDNMGTPFIRDFD
jgi:Pin2-interacting protein X1